MSERKVDPESLTLRARPRPVTRLNRRTIALAVGVLAAAVLGATLWSLQSQRRQARDAPTELHNVDRVARAEGLDQLPLDYSKVPRPTAPSPPMLGDPLPGDLGAPILRADRGTADTNPSIASQAHRTNPYDDAAHAERISRQREAEEAAKAPLFFRAASRRSEQPNEKPVQIGTSAVLSESPTPAGNAAVRSANGAQDQKERFLAATTETATRTSHSLQTPSSPYQIMAGSCSFRIIQALELSTNTRLAAEP